MSRTFHSIQRWATRLRGCSKDRVLGGLLVLAVLASGCRKGIDSSIAIPPVTVSHPISQPVTEYLDLTGTTAASRTVDLMARVSGYLESVNFQDGAFVEKGQLLFVIEPPPYEQQVALNEAVLVQAQAEYDRQQELIKQNATSTSNVEKWRSSRDQAQAQVELAKINLGYTHVTAPFAGRIGQRLVDPGNLVGTGSPTKLATLDQLLPIYVNFNLNERDALQMREAMRKLGMEAKSAVGKAPVEVGLSNEKGYPHQGVLDFVDNEISGSTGTIAMRAIFKNEDKTLFPGVFARVRIPLGDPRPMLVIPNSAIGNDQQGDYVFLVGSDDVVVRQTIVKGPLTASGDCAIRSGLAAADRVVVNGILNARPGQKVAPTERNAAPPAATP
jgi:RND family efflux transporter MFP subunit